MTVAISTGPETHLDHLAPLCSVLEIPLIVTDPDHFELGKSFYPMVELRYLPLGQLSLDYIAQHFETIVTCGKFWALELKPLIKLLYNKDIRLIFAPHGYSDKEELLNDPVCQDIELVYSSQNSEKISLGNLRLWFYKQHKKHFDLLAAPLFSLKKKTVLYAPTWETKATPTSFFEKMDEIVESFADEYHVLVKLHPLLEENNPAQFYRILGKYESRVTFIQNFPAIYPLLEKTNIYLGDYSSVGYDFLAYNRPMYFLKEGGQLQSCGALLNRSIEDKQETLKAVRERLYLETFGQEPDFKKLKALLNSSSTHPPFLP